MEIIPVILAGGSGTRLWPVSRELYPKQLLPLGTPRSLLQETLVRLNGNGSLRCSDPLVVCNEEHRFHVLEQAEAVGVPLRGVLLEPAPRNTGPALAAAALLLEAGDPLLVMTPADHMVDDQAAFLACVKAACDEAAGGHIAAIGLTPRSPETGYGYIGVAADALDGMPSAVHPVEDFVEKPDEATAARFLESRRYLWNSGVYVLRASTLLRAMKHFRPAILEGCRAAVKEGARDGKFFRLAAQRFAAVPAESVDCAIMEQAAGHAEFHCTVVPYQGLWSDVGSWQAVWELGSRDSDGNVIRGDAVARDTRDSLILSDGRLVAALGCEGLVIAETADAVLVADLKASQDVAVFVRTIRDSGREEALVHRRAYRPWGSYELLVSGDHYQVKRLDVKPGRQLSLQLHHRRAEHWVVVRGEATVQRGDEVLTLAANESVYIPCGTRHRLGNRGPAPLEVIEVQTGEYLGEDDIVRFEDDFGRDR